MPTQDERILQAKRRGLSSTPLRLRFLASFGDCTGQIVVNDTWIRPITLGVKDETQDGRTTSAARTLKLWSSLNVPCAVLFYVVVV